VNNDTQIMKGILEGCLLKIIEREEMYGYAAVEKLNQLGFSVNEATVYPILSRLQTRGLLHVNNRPSPFGPRRKYYSLTQEGLEYLNGFRQTWDKIRAIADTILEVDSNDQAK
jgi:PadR family transcriptional regulator PadR